MAQVTINLQNLKNGQEVEEWHTLQGVTAVLDFGSIRLKVRYLHDLIMPEDEYSPMKDLILDPKLEVVMALADVCHMDRIPLATSLLRIFR